MTEEQQRIAIAESVGWTKCEHVASINLTKGIPPANSFPKYGTYENGLAQLPDYLNDLNAMHEVEKKLKGMQWLNYVDSLLDVCGCETPTITANAAQRAEAYLRTIGKWVD